ncbi:LysE family translocator [Kerstersia similis]|uniref:LysE family translocator n=1 Tax=Kerstersia similis TaxID=206505 RepID=UPI0039F06AD3
MLSMDVALSFFGTAVVLALVPGPDNLCVLAQSAADGWRAGMRLVLGLCSGLVVHTAAVALGLAVVFQASALAFTILKLCGAAYLLYLAWQAFAHAKAASGRGQTTRLGGWALYRRGILMNVSNPKVSLFFLAFLPQFVTPGQGSVTGQLIALGALFMLAALLVFGAIALLAGRLGDLLRRSPGVQVWLNRGAGAVFLALAAKLVFSERS